MFLYKNLFFSISSVISIPIMLIGINGGYFPAICRVCFVSSGAIFFVSFFVHAAKMKMSIFLIGFCLSLTAIARVTSFLTLSQKFLDHLRDFDHTSLTSLNKIKMLVDVRSHMVFRPEVIYIFDLIFNLMRR